jgi:CHAD domain-containing protein
VKAGRVHGLDPDASLRANASSIVRTRLDEMRGFGDAALEPGAETAQHDLRIAAKRLRYVLEVTGSCFGAEAAAARDAAKEIQGVLGDIHDCDVMLPRAIGIRSLETLLLARRELLFRRFHDLWRGDSLRQIWSALDTSL